MYIQLPEPDQKCSECGAVNQHEYVSTRNKRVIRCTKCNHEKVLWEMHYTESKKPTYYNCTDKPKIVEF